MEGAELDPTRRHLRVRISGKTFVGIDPDWGANDPGVPMSPLVLTGPVRLEPASDPAPAGGGPGRAGGPGPGPG